MRKAALTSLVFVACGFATSAQLSVTPKVGVEQALACVQYNNTSGINPMGVNFSPQVSLRMDYLFKKAHGPFVGVASNRSLVTYAFTNPETGDKEFTATQGDWRLRFEAGYQVSSKPIALGKAGKQPAGKAPAAAQSPCAARMMQVKAAMPQKPVTNLRIQPFAGMAFVPNPQTAISTITRTYDRVYQYNAANYTSAFITGVNLAFAKGEVSKLVVGVQYLKGIGNLKTETLTTPSDNKQLNTQLSSSASAWNLTVGMPLTFSKRKPVVQQKTEVQAPAKAEEPKPVATPVAAPVKKTCGYYRHRCGY